MSIKRHPALQPFSRDHLIALLHAYRLQQAASGNERFDLQSCIDGFKEAWRNEIAIHFADEERLFVSLNAKHQSLQKLFDDHAQLRDLILRLYDQGEKETAGELGKLLEEHVRWEEHTLFPELETHWLAEQLTELEKATRQIELDRHRKSLPDDCPDVL